jgi:sec-independent protein translocase protein TatA
MGSLSIWHWLVVLVVVLLVFGPKRLAEVGKGLGEGIKGFKTGIKTDDDEADAPKLAEKNLDAKPSDKSARDTVGENKV